jgi:predicted NodU family carbamoyl transferase
LSFGAEMAQQDAISNISNRDWFRPFAAIQDSRNGPDYIQVDTKAERPVVTRRDLLRERT